MNDPVVAPAERRQRQWRVLSGVLQPIPGHLGQRLRARLYRPFFKSLARDVVIAENVVIHRPWGIELGPQVSIASGAQLEGMGGIKCGERVLIGPHSLLHTIEHVRPRVGTNWGATFGSIEVGAWAVITSHVVVTAGCRIGEAALIGAGAVVTHDVEAETVVAGVPARPIRALEG